MANLMTLQYFLNGSFQNQLAALTNPSTESVMQVNGNSITGAAAAPAVLSMPQAISLLPGLYPNGTAVFDGRPFKIRAFGIANHNASYTMAPKLYQIPSGILAAGTHGTLANDVLVAAPSAITFSGKSNWFFEAVLIWDSTSQVLNGTSKFWGAGQTIDAETVFTGLTGKNANDLNFLMSFTVGTSNAANLYTPYEFSSEVI